MLAPGRPEDDRDHPRRADEAPEAPARRGDPRVRPPLHRPPLPRGLDRGEGLARPARRAVRTDLARPGRVGAALRAGDLRGDEGLSPARWAPPVPAARARGAARG